VPVADLPLDRFVPAAGQGAIAVTAVDETDAAEAIHGVVDNPRTRVETTVERVVLAQLGAGCIAPMGVHAVIRGEVVHVEVQVLSRDGTEVVSGSRDLPVRSYVEAAREFAGDLI
ncbi:MAG: porphobilinogen deaminase, partial [Actinobacteria bacterium]|nr:porphobilinogen deaminase [Actinomycetota bacterium]NIU65546.1 porphobilinogen deaminase [Actinomycetota bacterium]NIW27362.1 porphobilinogen deaminase [Actinomycetota bacterium]NIX19889.1 porphobilinogen deaminase [Actinomycetota bacterium]